MYKSYTAADYSKSSNLPDNYRVEGVISAGTWNIPVWKALFEEQLQNDHIQYSVKQLPDFLNQVFEYTINGKIYWYPIVYGPVRLSEYIHLACLFGSKINIHVGSCGGLSPNVAACDIIIPTYSYDPGTSVSMYSSSPEVKPNQDLSDKVRKTISSQFAVHTGPMITCQGMLGETMEDVKKWSEAGYYGVEMEIATVLAVSNHFNVPSTTLVYVGDNLIKEESVMSSSFLEQKERRTLAKTEVMRVAQKIVIE